MTDSVINWLYFGSKGGGGVLVRSIYRNLYGCRILLNFRLKHIKKIKQCCVTFQKKILSRGGQRIYIFFSSTGNLRKSNFSLNYFFKMIARAILGYISINILFFFFASIAVSKKFAPPPGIIA